MKVSDYRGMSKSPKTARRRVRREPPPVYIGEWIRALGRRPVDVVRATGMNEGYLSSLINGDKKNPSPALVAEIARALDIPAAYLYSPPPDRALIERTSWIAPDILARLRGH